MNTEQRKKAKAHLKYAKLCLSAYRASNPYEVDGIQFVYNEDLRLFVFPGTDEIRDVITDVRILPWYDQELGWAPSGFVKVARKVAIEVLGVIVTKDIDFDGQSGKLPISLTGHSLGGAMALLTAAYLRSCFLEVNEVVTFGAPRCGRLKIIDPVEKTLYVNGKDWVPRVPPFMGSSPEKVRLRSAGGEDSRSFSDHMIASYVRALAKAAND